MAYNSVTPIVDGATVIISGTGAGRGTVAYKITKQGDTFTPTQLWTDATLTCQFCTPVLYNGLLYGVSGQGKLFCLKESDGTGVWEDQTVHGPRGGFGCMLAAGGFIFALPADGTLIVMQPDGKQVAHYQVSDEPTYTLPLLAGNRIFIKDQQTLGLWTIG
jgi:outer membrane protein assembly factor BamB